jgi:hypothetical protein
MQELLEVKLRLKDLVLYFLQKVRSFVCVRFLDDRMSLDRLRREQGFLFVIFDVFLKNGRSQPAEGLWPVELITTCLESHQQSL